MACTTVCVEPARLFPSDHGRRTGQKQFHGAGPGERDLRPERTVRKIVALFTNVFALLNDSTLVTGSVEPSENTLSDAFKAKNVSVRRVLRLG